MIYHHIGTLHWKKTHYEDTPYVSYILIEDSELPVNTTIPVKAGIVATKIIPGHLRRCSDPVGHFLFRSVAIIYEKTNTPNAGSLNFRSDQGDRDNDHLESNLYCAHILCIAGRTCQRVFQCDFIQTNVPLRLVVARVFCSSLLESGDLISVNPYGLKKLYTIIMYYNVKCSVSRSKASVFSTRAWNGHMFLSCHLQSFSILF